MKQRALITPERLESIRELDKIKQRHRRKIKGEIINTLRKDKYKENKDKIIGRNKAWRSANWDAVAKQRSESGYNRRSQKKWYHSKGKYDIQFVISERLRGRLRRALKNGRNNGATKVVSAIELVGCTPEQLIAHLQAQFRDGMTWENYGDWHIDHIRPCNSFNLQDAEQQKTCFHFTNLQPLWGRENILKGDKLPPNTEQVETQQPLSAALFT